MAITVSCKSDGVVFLSPSYNSENCLTLSEGYLNTLYLDQKG